MPSWPTENGSPECTRAQMHGFDQRRTKRHHQGTTNVRASVMCFLMQKTSGFGVIVRSSIHNSNNTILPSSWFYVCCTRRHKSMGTVFFAGTHPIGDVDAPFWICATLRDTSPRIWRRNFSHFCSESHSVARYGRRSFSFTLSRCAARHRASVVLQQRIQDLVNGDTHQRGGGRDTTSNYF